MIWVRLAALAMLAVFATAHSILALGKWGVLRQALASGQVRRPLSRKSAPDFSRASEPSWFWAVVAWNFLALALYLLVAIVTFVTIAMTAGYAVGWISG